MEEAQSMIIMQIQQNPQVTFREFEHWIEFVEEKIWQPGYWHCAFGFSLSVGRPAFRFWCHALWHRGHSIVLPKKKHQQKIFE